MNSTRHFRALPGGLAIAALFLCAGLNVGAQTSGSQEASQLINFSSEKGLRAEDAKAILSKRLELNSANDELRHVYSERPGNGLQVERFNQYYKGLRVEHGSFSMTSKNGVPSYAFGRFYPTYAVAGISPSLNEATAIDKARAAVPAERYMWESDPSEMPQPRLCLVEDFGKGDGDNKLHLAYSVDIYAERPMARYNVYIDAADGHVLFMDAILKHVAAKGKSLYSDTVSFNAGRISSTQYYLHDSTRGSGVFTYNANGGTSTMNALQVSSSTTFFAKDRAVDAHWGATMVYDYWKGTHNRNSWDGSGGRLRSYVGWSTNYNNASWNGQYMVYGDGSGLPSGFPPLTAIDVCAHEIGHGICASTAGLVYNREPGAMNEGLSDIWGAVVEAFADPHETDSIAKDPWLIGEELTSTLRSMRNPKLYQQPNTYLGNMWVNASSGCNPSAFNDNCGVHYNSGVLNYWFYLLCTGGNGTNDLGNNYRVTGIGMADAAKIVYAAELALNSTANYNSMRTATIAAATTIFGTCTPQLEGVVRAWYAVGVGNDYLACKAEISFAAPQYNVSENAGTNVCKPGRNYSVPLNVTGSTLTGDSAEVTVLVLGGSALAGSDYQLLTPKFSFLPGGVTTRTIDFLVYDNGAPDVDKYIDVTYTLNAGTTNAVQSIYKDTTRIYLFNDDYRPYIGGGNRRTVLSYTTNSTAITPFFGTAMGARAQYLYKAAELLAAGVRPGIPIKSLSFNVNSKVSTLPYYDFTVKLASIGQNDFSQGIYTGATTTVYFDSLSTVLGWTDVPFNAPYYWNGADNLLVEVCFGNPATYGGSDRIQAQAGTWVLSAINSNNFNPGCSLALGQANLQNARPQIQLNQEMVVETVKGSTRTWEITPIKEGYYYSLPDQKIIAAITSSSDSLGCTDVTISESGNGFKAATAGSQRSLKEFTIVAGAQAPSPMFDGIFYFSTAELDGKDPSLLKIVQTTAVDDAHLMPNDTRIVVPNDVIIGNDFVGFRGLFHAFGRFYLTEGDPQVSVKDKNKLNDDMWTGANPFKTMPVLHWKLSKPEQVSIHLYDVSGKIVFESEQLLGTGQNQLSLNTASSLTPGHYVLQVIRPGTVFTSRLIKE